MNLPPENPRDPLEAAIHRTLRAQPQRRAPRSLESRVFAELMREGQTRAHPAPTGGT